MSEKQSSVKVSFIEMIQLNDIKIRHQKLQLEQANQYLTILAKIKDLNSDTSIEEMEKVQSQLTEVLSYLELLSVQIAEDKKFVETIMQR
jgi:hypothetical protein